MSVSAISNVNNTVNPEPVTSRRQQEDIAGRQILEALGANDLITAQQAYNTLAAFGPNNSGPFKSPVLTQQFQALGQAIQSGDLAGAKQAAAALGKNLLKQDLSQAQKAFGSEGWPGARQSVENLVGDYWAVTGRKLQLPKQPPTSTANPQDPASEQATSVNVQA